MQIEIILYSLTFTNDGIHVFSPEEIQSFSEINKKLKQEARLKSKPEDLEKRINLEIHLQSIQDRIQSDK